MTRRSTQSRLRITVSAAAYSLVLLCGLQFMAAPAEADAIRGKQWISSALHITTAHRYSEGKGVTVAVIDSGVDARHVDLRGNVLNGTDYSTGVPLGDGHSDVDGHGTSMAGVIAGHGHGADNREGILGIAPLAKILPVRLFRHDIGTGGAAGLAVTWAVNHGATVISMSFGAPEYSSQIEAAMSAAETANVVLVAAVGNTSHARGPQYPAAYPGVVSAAGTNRRGTHANISLTDSDVVLSAPAEDVISTYKSGGYAVGSGTSSSAAIIAGAAALVRSRFPNLSADEVIHRLTATAIDKGAPGRDDVYGYGLINIVAALTANVPPLTSPGPSPRASAQPFEGVGATPTTTPAVALRPGGISNAGVIAVIAFAVFVAFALRVWAARRRLRRR